MRAGCIARAHPAATISRRPAALRARWRNRCRPRLGRATRSAIHPSRLSSPNAPRGTQLACARIRGRSVPGLRALIWSGSEFRIRKIRSHRDSARIRPLFTNSGAPRRKRPADRGRNHARIRTRHRRRPHDPHSSENSASESRFRRATSADVRARPQQVRSTRSNQFRPRLGIEASNASGSRRSRRRFASSARRLFELVQPLPARRCCAKRSHDACGLSRHHTRLFARHGYTAFGGPLI